MTTNVPVVLYGCAPWLVFKGRTQTGDTQEGILASGGQFKGDLKTLLSEEHHRLYCSPSIIWTMKSRRMRWAGHVARKGDSRNAYRFWWAKLKVKEHMENPDVGRIVLTRLLNRMTDSGMD
jgi:hypothetical protein